MRILHTADWHVGKTIRGESRLDEQAAVLAEIADVARRDHAELMKKFHFYRRRENLSTAAALRRAQLDLATAPDGRFRRPYFWAAFAVYGGYAEF